MYHIDWKREPDVPALRHAHGLLETDASSALTSLEGLAAKGSICSMWYLAHAYSNGEYITKSMESRFMVFSRC